MEAVEDYVENAEKPRIDILKEARARPCVCAGQWQPSAKALFANNALREQDWRYAVLQSVEHGRSKGTLVCHAGHAGNEGKSFLFAPLAEVFGEDQVFSTPPPGSFPLVGLERHRGVLLDDWRFNEDIVGYPLQLLWFEGKPIVIARPQNQFTGHLKYCKNDPIFITTLMSAVTMLKGKKIEAGDVAMMLKRLRIFEFRHQLVAPQNIKPCACCFANFLLPAADVPVGPTSSLPPRGPTSSFSPPKRSAPGPTGATPEAKRVTRWTVEQVCEHLDRIDLGHTKEQFRSNGIDGSFLAELSEAELMQELGLTRLQAKKVKSRLP